MTLEELRAQMDQIDDELVALLNKRAEISLEVGKQKASTPNARYFAPERERDLLKRIKERNAGGALPQSALVAIYREILSASVALQRPITVAYWGPPGTFTEMAAQQRFGASSEYFDCRTITDVFGEVERQRADYGVVPVENSTEGVVNYTLDQFTETSLSVCAEIFVPIVQNLLTHAKSLAAIKRVYTGPQPLDQCRRWLDIHLPHAEIVEVMPTTKAAERAASDPEGAAIVAKKAAEVYNVPLLFEQIEDNPNNRTRFLVVGHNQPPPTGRDKTSILFAVRNEPGSLVGALRSFEQHGVNLTMIHTRPARNDAWEYIQFVDIEGHADNETVRDALASLGKHAIYVKVLGSYPEAL